MEGIRLDEETVLKTADAKSVWGFESLAFRNKSNTLKQGLHHQCTGLLKGVSNRLDLPKPLFDCY